MANPEVLKALCYDDSGNAKPRSECRSTLINHLILDEMMDVDEAEDLVESTLNGLALWPVEGGEVPEGDGEVPRNTVPRPEARDDGAEG